MSSNSSSVDKKRSHSSSSSDDSSTESDDSARKRKSKKLKKEKKEKKRSKKEKSTKRHKDKKKHKEKVVQTSEDLSTKFSLQDPWLPKSIQVLTQKSAQTNIIAQLHQPLSTGVKGGGRHAEERAGKGWSRTNAIKSYSNSSQNSTMSTLESIVNDESSRSKS
jgi:signal recognition particle GTPase